MATRAEALVKAREAKKQKALQAVEQNTNKKEDTMTPNITHIGTLPDFAKVLTREERVWLYGLTAAMKTREAKSPADVNKVLDMADAVLAAFLEKFK